MTYKGTELNMAPTTPVEGVITVAEYTGKCACHDPGDCAQCPDKEYDEGGEG